jgi:hypothetical protein
LARDGSEVPVLPVRCGFRVPQRLRYCLDPDAAGRDAAGRDAAGRDAVHTQAHKYGASFRTDGRFTANRN